ncbi:hypothetical protein [Pseudomonas sp. 273]|uniref:hypothetical protein n=1 Tax=Pseudomonas sp. 273 TaxID=75692 RepID=UPI0023D81157|nr:hypothetical protein [Pseudomonas sp. 273]
MNAPRHAPNPLDERALLKILLLGVLALGLCGLGVAWLLASHPGPPSPPRSALERQAPQVPPPRLEADPRGAGAQRLAASERRLHGLGWVDRAAGIAHIPLEDAQRLLLQRGWPQAEAADDR